MKNIALYCAYWIDNNTDNSTDKSLAYKQCADELRGLAEAYGYRISKSKVVKVSRTAKSDKRGDYELVVLGYQTDEDVKPRDVNLERTHNHRRHLGDIDTCDICSRGTH